MGTMDEDMEQKYQGKFDHDRGPLFSWNFLEFSGLKKGNHPKMAKEDSG